MDVVLRNFLPLSLFFCLSCLCQTNGYLWGRENSNKQLETLVNRWDNKKYRGMSIQRSPFHGYVFILTTYLFVSFNPFIDFLY